MGSPPPHRIHRLVVELADCPRAAAAALQAAAGRLCQRDWLPAIERVCSAQVAAGQVLRIDRLQVDLGALPAAAVLAAAQGDGGGSGATGAGSAMVEQFEAALAASLGGALRQAAEVQTGVELLAFFLQTGALPWWADLADQSCVERAARALAGQPAAVWRLWLARGDTAAPDPARLRRLVASLPETLQLELLSAWMTQARNAAPAQAGERWTAQSQAAWLMALDRAAQALGQPPRVWRQGWWLVSLATALWPAADGSGWSALLRRWLATVEPAEAAVRQALRGALDAASAGAGQDADATMLAPLWQALAGRGPERAPAEADDGLAAVLAALGRLAARGGAEGTAWRHLQHRLVGAAALGEGATDADALAAGRPARPMPIDRLPQALRRRVVDAWARWQGGMGEQAAETGQNRLGAALQALLQAALQQGLIDPVSAGLHGDADRLARRAADWAAALGVAARPIDGRASPASSHPVTHPIRQPSDQPPPSPRRDTAAIEALYVHDAGLVLLWPFVQRFAERQGLLQPGKPVRWRDGAAAQRAAVLLHCAISGDAEPPEFQLLLAKLLCGLPLDAPLLLESALSSDEQAECEALLVAAIAQAPILRQMSVAGFRQAFGLREGQLSSRDGHWLLRVERQTFDVVIDRFPWSASLVRLPWMPALLQVQW